jgi:hypothetical protein
MDPTFIRELDALLARHNQTGNIVRQIKGNSMILTDLGAKSDTGRQMLRTYGHRFGLSEQDHGTIFTFRGTRYKLIGLKPSRPKYPLECEHMGDGRTFKFDTGVVPMIVAQRGRQPAAPAPQQPAPTIPAMQRPQTFQAPSGFPQF